MAKKDKNDAPNPNSVANKDIIHRLNFLYQASVYLNGMDTAQSNTNPSPSTSTQSKDREEPQAKSRKRITRKFSAKDLARSYVDNMRVIGMKTMVRMDPSVKRTLCKGCNTVLVPGSTATVRTKSSPSHGHVMAYTCLECRTSRRLPAPAIPPNESVTESAPIPTDEDSSRSADHLRRKRRTKKPPPLFAREGAGHVVFSGEKDITADIVQGLGNGNFIS